MNKRMITTLITNILTVALIALNNKLGLGLDTATVTALAGSLGVSTVGYLWSQAKTDLAENKNE